MPTCSLAFPGESWECFEVLLPHFFLLGLAFELTFCTLRKEVIAISGCPMLSYGEALRERCVTETQSCCIIDKRISLTKIPRDDWEGGGREGREKEEKNKWNHSYFVSCPKASQPVPRGKSLQCMVLQTFLFLHLCCKVTWREAKVTFVSFFQCHPLTSEEFLAGLGA